MLPFFPTIVENVTVSHGRKAVLKCEVENLRNYKVGAKQFPSESADQTSRVTGGRMYQCPRKERLSSSARKSTSGITERENVSVSKGRKVVLKCQEEYL
jgi:hypothetical protein